MRGDVGAYIMPTACAPTLLLKNGNGCSSIRRRVSAKRLRQLSNDRLGSFAKLVTKHDHDIAFAVCNRLACGVDRGRFNTRFLRCELVV